MKKILLTCLTAFYFSVSAQVGPPQLASPNTNNGYGFTQSSGTYTPLSASRTIWQSGATIGTDLVSGAIPLPTPFTYNNQKYSAVYISNNGFITLGVPAAANTYSGLSSEINSGTYEGSFAGFATNLRHASTTSSEISYETVGTKFIVQYTDVQGNSASASQLLNFQIQLDLTTGKVALVYGNCVSGSATLTGQVGIRGSESSDINNLTGNNWTSLTGGTANTNTATLGSTNGTTVPASGLTFTYTPGTWLSAPTSFASMPFTENFSTWANGNSTLDLPNANYWRTWPARGDNSWRQSDIASASTGFTTASGWNSSSGGSTVSAPAATPAARFHSFNCQYASGYMDLYINLSSGTGTRYLSFDYINPTGTDVLKIQLSTDGGNTFTDIGTPFGVSASWVTNFVDLGSSSPNAVVRFLAKGDNGSDDIYVDNVKVSAITIPDCTVISAPANAATGQSVTPSIKWGGVAGATSYKLSLGTTPGGTEVMNGVDVGNILSYTIPSATPLLYGTTYYATVFPTNSNGTANGCTGISFTTKNIGCPSVSAPSSGATGVSATPTINWSAVTDATGYKLSVGTSAGGTDVLNNIDLGNVITYTFASPLNYGMKYYYTVNAYTATSNSASCTERNFTVLALCPTVSAPSTAAMNVSTTPTFTWAAVAAATGYKITIGTTPGGNDVLNAFDMGNVTTYTLPTPLNNSTTYYYTIVGYSGSQIGTTCSERSFSTVCSSTTAPYTQNFDYSATGSSSNPNAPMCWSYLETSGSAGYGYVTTTAPSTSPNCYILFNSTDTTGNVMLVSPQTTNLSDGTRQVRFMAKAGAASGYTVQVGTISNPSDPASFTVIGSSISLTNAWTVYTVAIPAGTSQYLAFRHGLGGTSRSVYLDNISVENLSACVEPTGASASGATDSGVTISWTAPASAPAGGYEVYYSTSNTMPTASTVLNATNSVTSTTVSAPISGLTPATTYYAWVRSVCSASDKSIWTFQSLTFKTLCTPIMAPYSQNFDAGSQPNCWVSQNPSATTTDANLFWKFSGSADYGAATTYNGKPAGTYAWVDASSPYTGAGANTVQLLTPNINLTGLTDPYISFEWFKNHSSDDPTDPTTYNDNKLTVEVNNGSGWVSVFSNSSNSAQWRTVGIPLAPSYVGTTIQVRFTVDKNVSGNSYYYDDLLLDNVEVKQNPNLGTSEVYVKDDKIKVYPNPFTDTLTISDVAKVQSVSVVDLAGRLVKTIENPSSVLQLRDLKEGMYLVVMNRKDGTKQIVKAIKK